MSNLNLLLLSGGYYRCTAEWNAEPYGRDSCFKLYFPVEGEARICIDEKWYEIRAGNAYFINGFVLDKHCCDHFMNVYWLHFVPESQLLNMYLNNLDPVYCWDSSFVSQYCQDFKQIPELFENPYQKENRPMEMTDLNMLCKINALILKLISDMKRTRQADFSGAPYDSYYKLEPAVDFIDSNYNRNLSLEEMAQTVFLNPAYFLRLFKKCFHVTPNEYITMKRMTEASMLLTRTNMSVKEIAENAGYCNQFYFAKVFKKYFHKTPIEYRRKKHSP